METELLVIDRRDGREERVRRMSGRFMDEVRLAADSKGVKPYAVLQELESGQEVVTCAFLRKLVPVA